MGSDLTILALFTQFKVFLPIGNPQDGRLSWTQSFRTGLENAKDDEIPVIDRLRLGGEFSVRGYPTDSLGPTDAEGVPLGGEVMFVMNQELHSRLWGPVTGLVFFDVGNVWESFGSVDWEFEGGRGLLVGQEADWLSMRCLPAEPVTVRLGRQLAKAWGTPSLTARSSARAALSVGFVA